MALDLLYLYLYVVEITACSSDPCVNGATCVDHVGSYSCQCVPGYEGTNCQSKLNSKRQLAPTFTLTWKLDSEFLKCLDLCVFQLQFIQSCSFLTALSTATQRFLAVTTATAASSSSPLRSRFSEANRSGFM